MTLKSIVARLVDFAKNNEERAFAILGARPGPGIDILIKPVEPLCGRWNVFGQTIAGKGFIEKFWNFQPLNNQRVAEMRKQANEWGLTYETVYQVLSISDVETSKEYD
jgi:hypothetical protein